MMCSRGKRAEGRGRATEAVRVVDLLGYLGEGASRYLL
jgi:hypothetical protein